MPKQYDIAVIPGDGTGPEVVNEGIKVLERIAKVCRIDFEFRFYHLGGEHYMSTG